MKKTKPLYLILLLALFLRLINLNQSLWLDEGIQWWASTSFSLPHLVTEYIKGDFNPPLFHTILHFWIKLFGDSEISLRLPSVMFGVATVYFVYKITELLKLKNKFSILNSQFSIPEISSLLIATGPLLIYYSQEARMYSLAAFTTVAAFYFLLKYKAKKNKLFAIYYVLLSISMLYSHYLTWLLIPLFLFIQPLLTGIALLALLPWLPILWQQTNQGLATVAVNPVWAQTVGSLTLKNLALVPIKFLIGRIPIEANLAYTILLLPPLLFLFYLLSKSLPKKLDIRHPSVIKVIWLWLTLPLILGAIVSTKVPVFSYFRFLFIIPAFYILLTVGISKLTKKFQTIAFIFLLSINLLASGYYLLASSNHRENWKGAVSYIHSFSVVEPVIIQSAVRSPFEYYDQGRTAQISEKNLEELINLPSVWYIPYAQPIFDPEDNIRQTLKDLGFQQIEKKHFRGVTIERYKNFNSRLYSSLYNFQLIAKP